MSACMNSVPAPSVTLGVKTSGMRAGHDLTNHSLTGTLCLLLSISHAVPKTSSRYWDRGNPFTVGSKKRKAYLAFGTVPSMRKTLKASQTTLPSPRCHSAPAAAPRVAALRHGNVIKIRNVTSCSHQLLMCRCMQAAISSAAWCRVTALPCKVFSRAASSLALVPNEHECWPTMRKGRFPLAPADSHACFTATNSAPRLCPNCKTTTALQELRAVDAREPVPGIGGMPLTMPMSSVNAPGGFAHACGETMMGVSKLSWTASGYCDNCETLDGPITETIFLSKAWGRLRSVQASITQCGLFNCWGICWRTGACMGAGCRTCDTCAGMPVFTAGAGPIAAGSAVAPLTSFLMTPIKYEDTLWIMVLLSLRRRMIKILRFSASPRECSCAAASGVNCKPPAQSMMSNDDCDIGGSAACACGGCVNHELPDIALDADRRLPRAAGNTSRNTEGR